MKTTRPALPAWFLRAIEGGYQGPAPTAAELARWERAEAAEDDAAGVEARGEEE